MTALPVRLFLGLELNDDARCALDGVRRTLEESGVIGKYHSSSMYHLTLCFLGNLPEESIPQIKQIMDSVPAAPFSLTLSALGTFKNGSVLWAGVEECEALRHYQRRLADALREAGFPLEPGEYTPHITLARQVKSPAPGLTIPPVSFSVPHAALFHSTRIGGVLTYLPIYRSVFR